MRWFLVIAFLFEAGCVHQTAALDVSEQLLSPIDVAQRHCDDDWRALARHNNKWGNRVCYFPTVDGFGEIRCGVPSCISIHEEVTKLKLRKQQHDGPQ
jgi:hypothetical protein